MIAIALPAEEISHKSIKPASELLEMKVQVFEGGSGCKVSPYVNAYTRVVVLVNGCNYVDLQQTFYV